ncbi:MAG: glycosyltransferase [Planctomycetes bacterium]|nr:glycosyltransferase [Planctomycetota bacterium]
MTDRDPIPVLFVNTDLRVGGQERVLVEVLRGLDRSKVRPVVACLKDEGALGPQVRALGVPLHAKLLAHKFDLRVLPRLIGLVRRERIEVVCTVGCGDKMFWGRLAGWLGGAKGIVSEIHKTRDASGRPVIERMNRLLAPITDAFVAVAHGAADYLVEHEGVPRAKVVVIHNGVDVERFDGSGRTAIRAELQLADDQVALMHVAVFRPEKGHAVVLRALRQVVDVEPRVRLFLIGDGPERPAIERTIAELSLGGHVTLLGQRDDVERLLAAGDIALLASFDRVETFPVALLEAMASGLPIVATRVGSVHEMVTEGENGTLVAPGEDVGLAGALLRLIGDPALRSKFGIRSSARARLDFHWENMVRAREQLFQTLARRSE